MNLVLLDDRPTDVKYSKEFLKICDKLGENDENIFIETCDVFSRNGKNFMEKVISKGNFDKQLAFVKDFVSEN